MIGNFPTFSKHCCQDGGFCCSVITFNRPTRSHWLTVMMFTKSSRLMSLFTQSNCLPAAKQQPNR